MERIIRRHTEEDVLTMRWPRALEMTQERTEYSQGALALLFFQDRPFFRLSRWLGRPYEVLGSPVIGFWCARLEDLDILAPKHRVMAP